MTAKYKPGSRVQAVWEVYESQGAEAAFNHGLTLSLKPGTLRSWVRMWAKENGQTTTKVTRRNTAGNTMGKQRVVASWNPRRKGYVTIAGAQVSTVRWDEMPNELGGYATPEEHVQNKYLIEEK